MNTVNSNQPTLLCNLASFYTPVLSLQTRRGNRDNLVIIFHISTFKTYVVTDHKSRLVETVLMKGTTYVFVEKYKKNYL